MKMKLLTRVLLTLGIPAFAIAVLLLSHAHADVPGLMGIEAGQSERTATASDTPYATIIPDQMTLTGDVVVCSEAIPDPTVASWCAGVPEDTIILGVDPNSPEPDDWDGGQATKSLDIDVVNSPTVALITIAWRHLDGKGIHSPKEGKVATISWDGVPIWTKRTRDVSTFGDYYAVEHRDVVATAVLTQPATHTLVLQVPKHTAWDISSITVHLHRLEERLRGIAYGPFRDCQNPHWGPFPSEAEIQEDVERLYHMSNGIRTYSSLGALGEIPRIVHERGLPVCVGAWLGREEDGDGNPVENKNRQEIDALINIAQTVPVDCVIVGNEVLLRRDLTMTDLLNYINEVKAAVDVPVTTAEIGGILNRPEYAPVLDAIDFIMVHIYAYWDGQPIENAADYVVDEYLWWREAHPEKRVVIGETGWPSDGPAKGQAIPSLENQRRFFYEFLAAAEQYDIEFYYFDAIDELWKREGGVGSHWGYAYADRTGKYEVQSVLVPRQHLFSWIYLPLVSKGGQGSAVAARFPEGPQVWPQLIKPPSVQQVSGDEFTVFGEYCAEENHFAPSGWMGDWSELGYYECDRDNPYSGQVSIRITYTAQGPNGWAGIYWQEPDGNWGTKEGAGYDLDDATYLRFHARGDKGGEQLKFFMGGIWNPQGEYPDSQQPPLSTDVITLTENWDEYTIDLRGRDLSYVIGGFGFVTNQCLNSEPITFYLDDIHYVMAGDPGPPEPTPTPETPYTFDVYRDRDIAGNHYTPSGWMGDTGDIELNECYRDDTHSGSTAIRVRYTAEGNGPHESCDAPPCNWAGVYWQHPAENWGDRPGGYDLTGARALTFWAKGENGGEKISFKIGGVGCDSGEYPDSLCPVRVFDPAPTVLTTTWTVYTVPLSADLNLSHLVGGFLWTASKSDNPTGATFYLDDIQYHFNIDMPSSAPFSTPPIPIGAGSGRTFDLAFGDADNDGDLDVAVATHGANQMCWNNGDHTFACEENFGGYATFDVEWGDMDNDGDLDLVVANSQGIANLVCFNNGDGEFPCENFSICPGRDQFCRIALGDVDSDNDLDIALSIWQTQDLIYFNDGHGAFPITTTTCTDSGWTRDLDFGDVDDDGDLDLIVVGDSPDYICINDGTGTFTETRWLQWRKDSTRSVAVGDVDADGDLDIAAGESNLNPSEVYLNNGRGLFTQTVLIRQASDVTLDIAWADVDSDGDLDLALGNSYRPTMLYFNEPVTTTSSFTLTNPIYFGGPAQYRSLSVIFGDIDNDCDLDLAASRDGGQNVIFLNTSRTGCVFLSIIMKKIPQP